MKKIFLNLFLFSIIPVLAGDLQKIEFFRPAREGNITNCRLSAVTSTATTTTFADIKVPDRKTELNQSLTADGILKIISVKKNGHAAKIEFTVKLIEGENNKERFAPDWQGKTIIADLTVKPVCGFRLKDSDNKLSQQEIQMLSLLFRPAPDENMADYIGTDQAVKVGDSWNAKVSPFINLFKRQGLILPEKHVKGTVTLKSRKQYEGMDCWEIEEKLNVKDLPNFMFHFSLSVFLPVDEKLGNIKMTRKAFEQIEKVPSGEHFMTSGIKKITLEMKDTMTAIMVPEE